MSARPKQQDCRYEPAYPDHDTVVCAMAAPDITVHRASPRCEIDHPHPISECGEFIQGSDPEGAK